MGRIVQEQESRISHPSAALAVAVRAGGILPGGRPAPAGVESIEEDAALPGDLAKCAAAIVMHLLRPWAAFR